MAIPSISPDVPTEIAGTSPVRRLGLIAQGLVEAGVLYDADWTGDLVGTINGALTRWVNIDLGLARSDSDLDQEIMPMSLWWLDDMSSDERFYTDSDFPIGAFVLDHIHGEPNLVTVGYWLDRFDRFLPGIGGDLMSALSLPAEYVFNGMTPGWAYERSGELFDCGAAEEEEEGEGYSQKAFERLLPRWVYSNGKPDVNGLKEARDMAPAASVEDDLTDRIREASALALEILGWHGQCLRVNEAYRFCEYGGERGIAVRWQCDHNADPTGWVMDDEIDMMRNSGEASPLLVLISFSSVEEVVEAVESLAATLRLSRALNDLMKLLHDERAVETVQNRIEVQVEPERVRIRV